MIKGCPPSAVRPFFSNNVFETGSKIHWLIRLSFIFSGCALTSVLFELDLSERQISKSTQISRSTISDYLRRFAVSSLSRPLPQAFAEADIEAALFPAKPALPDVLRPVPDWDQINLEMRRKGVTLFLLWQEYKTNQPEGFNYSWFCEHYRKWAGRLDAVMRQEHLAGEKCFVDYAGHTMPVTDRHTGEIRQAQIFVGVMGASNYTFAEATFSQALPDWIGSHVRMLEHFGVSPEILVPDNLKSGVSKTCRYEPDANPTYLDFANHYGIAVIPARSRKPRDKACVENGVLIVERWILACLRNRSFFRGYWRTTRKAQSAPVQEVAGVP